MKSTNSSKGDGSEAAILRALDLFLVSKELVSLEQALGGFNLFRTLGITDKELFHSRILAWLIKPHESHGLGDLFLRRWLMRILLGSTAANPHTFTLHEVDGAQWVDADIATEVPLKSGQRLDVEARLYLRGQPERRWWVIVEAKVGSKQSDDQLADYRAAIEAKAGTDEKRMFVFLTRDFEEPDDSAWHKATFDSVYETLKECLEIREGSIAEGPAMLLRDYNKILEEQFMSDSKVAERVRLIFKEHPEALAAIDANWPDPVRELTKSLHAHLTNKAKELGIHVFSGARAKDYFRFASSSWNVDPNSPSVFGYVELDEKTVSIRIFATPDCPAEKKDKLVLAAQSHPFKRGRRTKTDKADWPTLDSGWTADLLTTGDSVKIQTDACQKIENAFKEPRLREVIEEVASILK